MILGKTYDEKYQERQAYLTKKITWTKWFAWYPVKFGYITHFPNGQYCHGNGRYVWMQTILRRKSHYIDFGVIKLTYGYDYILNNKS